MRKLTYWLCVKLTVAMAALSVLLVLFATMIPVLMDVLQWVMPVFVVLGICLWAVAGVKAVGSLVKQKRT